MTPQTASPAIILRPLPFPTEEAQIAGYFGGTPIMPPDMEWPRSRGGVPLLFVAQIDLGVLPAKVHTSGGIAGMPQMPRDGTLYVFWDAMLEGIETRVLHAPQSATAPELREVPEDMPDFGAANPIFVDRESLQTDGKTLRRIWFEALPYLSHRAENELARNMDRADGADLRARDAADALQDLSLEAVLGRGEYPHVTYTFPWLPNHDPDQDTPPEGMLPKLLGGLRRKTRKQKREGFGLDQASGTFAVPETFPWRWCLVREVAERVKALATLGENHLYDFWNGDAPVLLHLWKDAPAQADQWISRATQGDGALDDPAADAFRGWLDMLANAALHLDVQDAPDPAVLKAARPHQQVLEDGNHKMFTWPDRNKTPAALAAEALVPMLGCIREHVPSMESRVPDDEFDGVYWSDESCPVPYYELWDAWYVPRKRLMEVLEDAMAAFSRRVWRFGADPSIPQDLRMVADWDILRQTTLPKPRADGHNFGDNSRVPIQMFGAGFLMQNAAVKHADKVLLFQMSEGFGLPVNLHDGIVQVWIAPEDLAAGRFDQAFSTAECT